MCGLAASAWRMSLAACESLKTKGAVVLVPMTSASAFRSSTCNCLKRCTPYSAKPIPATHNAPTVLIMITSMILRRSEDLWSHGISVFPRRSVRLDVLRHAEQLGAHLQPCPVRGIHVDGEPNAAVFERELDHPTGLEEAIHLSNRQHARSTQAGKNLRKPLSLQCADKQDVDSTQVVRRAVSPDDQVAPLYRLSINHLWQLIAERVLPYNSNHNRSFGVQKGVIRPLDEPKKVKHVPGLDPVFGRSPLRAPLRRIEEERQHQPAVNQTRRPDAGADAPKTCCGGFSVPDGWHPLNLLSHIAVEIAVDLRRLRSLLIESEFQMACLSLIVPGRPTHEAKQSGEILRSCFDPCIQ